MALRNSHARNHQPSNGFSLPHAANFCKQPTSGDVARRSVRLGFISKASHPLCIVALGAASIQHQGHRGQVGANQSIHGTKFSAATGESQKITLVDMLRTTSAPPTLHERQRACGLEERAGKTSALDRR